MKYYSICLGNVLRQEDKIQALKYLETKRRVQKSLVAKMLRLERKQILGGSFLSGPKEQRGLLWKQLALTGERAMLSEKPARLQSENKLNPRAHYDNSETGLQNNSRSPWWTCKYTNYYIVPNCLWLKNFNEWCLHTVDGWHGGYI